jgi:hypothetical protein
MKKRYIKVITKEDHVVGPIHVSWLTWWFFRRDIELKHHITTLIDKKTKKEYDIPVAQIDVVQYMKVHDGDKLT